MRGEQRNEAGMKRGEREGETFSVELIAVIGEREGGARGQREAAGGGTLWALVGKQRRRWCHGSDRLHVVCACGWQPSGRWGWAVFSGWAGTVDMGWHQSCTTIFQLFKLCSNLKYKTKTILMSTNV
jgi:hypothetical protein